MVAEYLVSPMEVCPAARRIEEASGRTNRRPGDEFAAGAGKDLTGGVDALKIIFDEIEAAGWPPEAAA